MEDFKKFFKGITIVLPVFIVTSCVLSSLISMDLRGIMYMFGIIISYFIITCLNYIKSSPNRTNTDAVCSTLDFYWNGKGKTKLFSSSLMFYCFSLFYIFGEVMFNTISISTNVWGIILMIILVLLIPIDIYMKIISKCYDEEFYKNTYLAIFGGLFLGTLFGIGWYWFIKSYGNGNLLYFSQSSNMKTFTCAQNNKDNFSCKLFKGGKEVNLGNDPNATP
jgi:hypothetical protein